LPFVVIRVGDIDGFGYGTGAGFTAANGGPVNVGMGGVLGAEMLPTIGDFLPDLNLGGGVLTGGGDDFDNRLGETIAGSGFTDVATTGELFTDIALSTSYDASSTALTVYNDNTGTSGAGGAFPVPPSTTLSNQPGFVFDFFVATGDITSGTPIFFNFVFADYDVQPATLDFERMDGSTFMIVVTPQNNAQMQDGLIQVATASLAFADVFTPTIGGFDGFLKVDFMAPNEPYTAFDYVELSVTPATLNPIIGGEIIPIEATGLLLANVQSFSWMIPVALSVLGIGLFVVSRKSNE